MMLKKPTNLHSTHTHSMEDESASKNEDLCMALVLQENIDSRELNEKRLEFTKHVCSMQERR